jgi:tetratricopeptide (TPR) repeat protein
MLAREQYEHALVLARQHGARQIEGRALRGLGDVDRLMGHLAGAKRYFNEAAAIANELDTSPERCAVLHRLGELYVLQEQYQEALQVWVEALAQDRRIGHPDREALLKKVMELVAEHQLEAAYEELCGRYQVE